MTRIQSPMFGMLQPQKRVAFGAGIAKLPDVPAIGTDEQRATLKRVMEYMEANGMPRLVVPNILGEGNIRSWDVTYYGEKAGRNYYDTVEFLVAAPQAGEFHHIDINGDVTNLRAHYKQGTEARARAEYWLKNFCEAVKTGWTSPRLPATLA